MVVLSPPFLIHYLVIFTSFPGRMSHDFIDKISGIPCSLIKEDRTKPVLDFYKPKLEKAIRHDDLNCSAVIRAHKPSRSQDSGS